MTKENQINVEEHLPLVKFVIQKYFSYILGTEYYDDYHQEGCVGLLSAANRFDPDRGIAFSTFAVKTIIGNIQSYKRDYETSKLPRALHSVWAGYIRMKDEYDNSEICKELGISEADLKKMICVMQPSSMDYVVCECDHGQRIELVDLVRSNVNVENEAILNVMINSFPKEKPKHIAKLYAFGYTQQEIAGLIGNSQKEVSKNLSKVKKYLAG